MPLMGKILPQNYSNACYKYDAKGCLFMLLVDPIESNRDSKEAV